MPSTSGPQGDPADLGTGMRWQDQLVEFEPVVSRRTWRSRTRPRPPRTMRSTRLTTPSTIRIRSAMSPVPTLTLRPSASSQVSGSRPSRDHGWLRGSGASHSPSAGRTWRTRVRDAIGRWRRRASRCLPAVLRTRGAKRVARCPAWPRSRSLHAWMAGRVPPPCVGVVIRG